MKDLSLNFDENKYGKEMFHESCFNIIGKLDWLCEYSIMFVKRYVSLSISLAFSHSSGNNKVSRHNWVNEVYINNFTTEHASYKCWEYTSFIDNKSAAKNELKYFPLDSHVNVAQHILQQVRTSHI